MYKHIVIPIVFLSVLLANLYFASPKWIQFDKNTYYDDRSIVSFTVGFDPFVRFKVKTTDANSDKYNTAYYVINEETKEYYVSYEDNITMQQLDYGDHDWISDKPNLIAEILKKK